MTQFIVFLAVFLGMSLDAAIPVGCDVKIKTRTNYTGRCDFDEVVQSIDSLDPLRIKCGEITVSCPVKTKSSSSLDAERADASGTETSDPDR